MRSDRRNLPSGAGGKSVPLTTLLCEVVDSLEVPPAKEPARANLDQIFKELRSAVRGEMWRCVCTLAGSACEGLLRVALLRAGLPETQVATISLRKLHELAIKQGLLPDPATLVSRTTLTSASAGSVTVVLRNWAAHFSLRGPVFDAQRAGRATVMLLSLSEHLFPSSVTVSDSTSCAVIVDSGTDWSAVPMWQLRRILRETKKGGRSIIGSVQDVQAIVDAIVSRGSLRDIVCLAEWVRCVWPTEENYLRSSVQSHAGHLIKVACHSNLRYLDDASRAFTQLSLPALTSMVGWLLPLDCDLLRFYQGNQSWVDTIFYLQRCKVSDYAHYQSTWNTWTRPDKKGCIWADILAMEFWTEWQQRPASLVSLGNFLRQIPSRARVNYLRAAPISYLQTEISRQDLARTVNLLTALPETTPNDGLEVLRRALKGLVEARLKKEPIRELAKLPWRIYNIAASSKYDLSLVEQLLSYALQVTRLRWTEDHHGSCRMLWDTYQVFPQLSEEVVSIVDEMLTDPCVVSMPVVLFRLEGIRYVSGSYCPADVPNVALQDAMGWLHDEKVDRWTKMQIILGVSLHVTNKQFVQVCRGILGGVMPDTKPETEASTRLYELTREALGLKNPGST